MPPQSAKSRKKEPLRDEASPDTHSNDAKVGFLELPLELRLMVFEQIFAGSLIHYSATPVMLTQKRLIRVFKLRFASRHRNILSTSKQLRREGLPLYYRKSELHLDGTWETDDIIHRIPLICRNNIGSLSLDRNPPTQPDRIHQLRRPFPQLRQVCLPAGPQLISGHHDVASDTIFQDEFKVITDLWHGIPRYKKYRTAWPDINIVKEHKIALSVVEGKSAREGQEIATGPEVWVKVKVDIFTGHFVSSWPHSDPGSTIADMHARVRWEVEE